MAICCVEDCGRKVVAKALCGLHYQRSKNGVDMSKPAKTPAGSHIQFLQSLLDTSEDDCIAWPFSSKNIQGYGVIQYQGRRSMGAHRAMCIMAHGDPGPDMQACHSCGRGHLGCVNPRHLRWGTCSDNKADMAKHGTLPYGEKQHFSVLKNRDVIRIDRDLKLGIRNREISRMYGVSEASIHRISTGQQWGWLTGRKPNAVDSQPIAKL